ncbi:phragmoplast orienting kinesin 2-like [Heracleum sosnowskyi]|uniref:Phragmoplast orienting kinesin 2-like n=1 Tax=Heracleum sosnowskyi TaxID=360622 RepID=A0AAD8NB32_9APIA|nr:phragmoplast orienting kinesin 2-like [Heracleum sosnowskyi]
MLRDTRFSQRNLRKSSNLEEKENAPLNTNTIPDEEVDFKSTRLCKTPLKACKSRCIDTLLPLKTPEKQGVLGDKSYGVSQKNVLISSNVAELGIDSSRDYKNGNGGFGNVITPMSSRPIGKGNLSYSTHSTPVKSVTRPPNPKLCLTGGGTGVASVGGGARMANFAALSKGVPISSSSLTVVNTIEVPHFGIKEDSNFWMDHNVQVLIRVRPLSGAEKSMFGYNRCLKQESAQCITWIGQPESRFTFDHIACETLDQETLFTTVGLPMVENCLSGYNSCIFAYGQTGSGKTYTMLGDLGDKSSPDRGMTSRIFEFLFARIRAERESRRDDRLVYNLKCSFSEIYNEQITDLLDPSSTNLLLREDTRTGIYVENLSEYEVQTVGDILKLLSQGSSNRKVAATNMNRESSRSHSVFTCVIESRWEKDSMPYLRFARLNLVDLAGSERQKTSGAEGDRLKEAANINKSLSTLGHVIMLLGDVVHAKTKHVPYRDSKLTFLLQDSLGGNSKTMIIANVSPSICCAAETLNTLKFAQRAKLIQNNAVVNEDSPEAVTALKYQIHLLKEELLVFKKQNVARSLTFGSASIENTRQENDSACKITELEMGYQNKEDSSDQESNLKVTSRDDKLFEAVQHEKEEMHQILLKRTQQVVDLQLESDILKIMLQEERSFRRDQESKALCLNRDLELAKEKASQVAKQYENTKDELIVAKSLILESERLTSFREMEDLRSSCNHYVDQLHRQETEISLLKMQAFNQVNPSSCKLSKAEESYIQVQFTKMHDSLEEVRKLNTWHQSDFSSHGSNKNEMDEVLQQARAETAKVIIFLQEELGILQQQVQKSYLREMETEGELITLKNEHNELHTKLDVATQNNKSLVEKLDEKDKQYKALSEMLELGTTEIEVFLSCGQKALEDATDQIDAISGSLPQKRNWISELSRMRKSIYEKEFMIEELTRYLEEATTRRSEMESMLRSLRGAALVITQEYQQDCREKEKEVFLLTSELSEKVLIIAELENKLKREEEERRNASMCATAAFVVASRLSEKNCEYLNAMKNKDIHLTESIELIMQKDTFLHNQAVECDGQKQICYLRNNLEVARLQLSGALKHVNDLEQNLKQVEKANIMKTTKILEEVKDFIISLKSWLKHSDDVLSYQDQKFILDLPAKEIEVLVLASELEQMAFDKFRLQTEYTRSSAALEKVKEDLILKCLDAELKDWILVDKENEVTGLLNATEVATTELNKRNSEILDMKKVIEVFEQDLKLFKDVACLNDTLKEEIGRVTEANMRLSSKIAKDEQEYEKSLEDMQVSCNENGKRLQEALHHMQSLEKEIAAKDREMGQYKTCISELSQHSGAHARDYKQKPAKNDKHSAVPHVAELKSLGVKGQEILMLELRLAAAKSITCDVLCDLRDLRSDICDCVSSLDKHQVPK